MGGVQMPPTSAISVTMTPPPPRCGIFGKLPCRGDYLLFGIPEGILTPWSQWLDACLGGWAQRMPDQWRDLFLDAPFYRFRIGADLIGGAEVSGIWSPGCDKVGRPYPMTLLQWQGGLADDAPWWLAVEDLLVDHLHIDADPAALFAAFRTLPLIIDDRQHLPPDQTAWWRADMDPGQHWTSQGWPDADAALALLDEDFSRSGWFSGV